MSDVLSKIEVLSETSKSNLGWFEIEYRGGGDYCAKINRALNASGLDAHQRVKFAAEIFKTWISPAERATAEKIFGEEFIRSYSGPIAMTFVRSAGFGAQVNQFRIWYDSHTVMENHVDSGKHGPFLHIAAVERCFDVRDITGQFLCNMDTLQTERPYEGVQVWRF